MSWRRYQTSARCLTSGSGRLWGCIAGTGLRDGPPITATFEWLAITRWATTNTGFGTSTADIG